VIEDLEGESPEVWRPRIARPRVASEPILWAFLSALGAGFIANGVAEIALAVLWPLLVPPTQPRAEWLNPFAVSRAAQFVAMGAVALRAGGIPALVLCAGYEVALVVAQLPNRIAVCERLPEPDPFIPCGFSAIAVSTWPTWVALAVGIVGSRRLLPPSVPGANTLLRATGAFAFALTVAGIAWGVGRGAVFDGLALVGWLDPQGSTREPSFQVVASTFFLSINLLAGLLAGLLLRRAPSAAVVLLALLIGYGVGLGVAQIRHNVDTGVPHFPLELAYLQSMNALTPAAGILGIALGRLLARRNRVLTQLN
jgi:hypothetical protein